MSNPYQQPDPYGGGYGQPQQPGYGAPQQQPSGYGVPPQQPPAAPGYGYPQQQQPPAAPGYGYPQQAPQPYGQQPGYPAAPQPNQLATASVALGFIAILLVCVYGGVLGLVGLGLGIAGINRAGQTGVGRNAAIGGVVLNTLAVLITIAVVVFAVVASKS